MHENEKHDPSGSGFGIICEIQKCTTFNNRNGVDDAELEVVESLLDTLALERLPMVDMAVFLRAS